MPQGTVDRVINALILPIILGGVIWLFREPIGRLIKWIKGFFNNGKDGEGGIIDGYGNIDYE